MEPKTLKELEPRPFILIIPYSLKAVSNGVIILEVQDKYDEKKIQTRNGFRITILNKDMHTLSQALNDSNLKTMKV